MADAIIAEKNYGGDMVRHTLESTGRKDVRVILVDSRRGKMLRAEPIVEPMARPRQALPPSFRSRGPWE